MKLQNKFLIGIITIFAILSISIGIISVNWINKNTIIEAKNRVKVYINAAWTIHDNKLDKINTSLRILAQENSLKQLLLNPEDKKAIKLFRDKLVKIRKIQNLDILNVLDANGKVIIRSRFPFNKNDTLPFDEIVKKVLLTKKCYSGNLIFSSERLKVEGEGLIERCLRFGGEPKGLFVGSAIPIIIDDKIVGVIEGGNIINGDTEEVDKIRDSVFENKFYKGKPIGTATIFMGDLRISTNVIGKNGKRMIGTRVSREVADQVLKNGISWTGRAWVVNAWYISQYDPIKNPENKIIGMLYVGELEERYIDFRKKAIRILLITIFAVMVFAIFVFFSITRSILKPLKELTYATNRFSEGDLSYRVGIHTRDEIGELSLSFNRMAEQLEKQQRKIQHQKEVLEETNEKLKAINKNYMDMLGFVTHELKNPLASAIMSVYTVKDGYLGELNASQKKMLDTVAKSLDYFNDMIKNYLDLSRLEKGELKVNKREVLFKKEVVLPILEGLKRSFEEKNMVVEDNIPEDIVLNVDRDLLRIVYDNFLSNAVKYGKEGGKIILDGQIKENSKIFCVFNEGRGIPEDKMHMLFKKFSRIDTPEHINMKGTGLGLFICKEIIEKHGGKIWAESEEGKWAKFCFELPS